MRVCFMLLLLPLLSFQASHFSDNRPTEIFKKLLVNYKKSEPPSIASPTNVKLGIYINSFYSINEQTMDYSVSMYLRQRWLDPRLSFKHLANHTQQFKMPDLSWNLIWLPDTFFRNEKSATFHGVTVHNRMLRLYDNGTVWYVVKITATFACPMNLQFYPLDTQTCPLLFESFGYTTETLTYSWIPGPVEIEDNLQLPQYSISNFFLTDCIQNYTAGQFPCLQVSFRLRREIGYYLIQVYVPSVLIVILSWVSFWIHVDASPARVSIGLLTVLTTTTMSAGARATLPRVSYIKALDVWMISCLIFVFAGLIEYAIVNVVARGVGRSKRGRKTSLLEAPRCGLMHRKKKKIYSQPNECLIELEDRGVRGGWAKKVAEVTRKRDAWVRNEESDVVICTKNSHHASRPLKQRLPQHQHQQKLQHQKQSLFSHQDAPQEVHGERMHGERMHGEKMDGERMHGERMHGERMDGEKVQKEEGGGRVYVSKQGSYNDAFDEHIQETQHSEPILETKPQHSSQQQQQQQVSEHMSQDDATKVKAHASQQPRLLKQNIFQETPQQQQQSFNIRARQKFQQQKQFQAATHEQLQLPLPPKQQQQPSLLKQQQQQQVAKQQRHHMQEQQRHVSFIPCSSDNNNSSSTKFNNNTTFNNNNNNNNLPLEDIEECCCPVFKPTRRRFVPTVLLPCCQVPCCHLPCCQVPADGKKKASMVDKVSRRLFPSLFLFFNLVYWSFYTATLEEASA